MTEHSIASVAELQDRLAQVRRDGLARDWCESNVDVACIAAPVLDRAGAAVAAMSISVPASRFTEEYQAQLTPQLLRAAERLMASIGPS